MRRGRDVGMHRVVGEPPPIASAPPPPPGLQSVTVPGDPGLELRVWVPGVPAAQGSKRAIGRRRNGSTILIESSTRLRPWRDRLRDALTLAHGGRPPFEGPVELELTFMLPRLPSYRRTGTVLATKKPDLDKLLRAVGDALTDARVLGDDSQITTLSNVRKRVCEPGALPGVEILVRPDKYL